MIIKINHVLNANPKLGVDCDTTLSPSDCMAALGEKGQKVDDTHTHT